VTRQEKLVVLVAVLLVLTRVGALARTVFISRHYGAFGLPAYDQHVWQTATFIWGGLVNIGGAIWLFVEARAAALRYWLWSLFGLCFGLLGVALFYLVQLYAKHYAPKT
jgi:hypothetical protein